MADALLRWIPFNIQTTENSTVESLNSHIADILTLKCM